MNLLARRGVIAGALLATPCALTASCASNEDAEPQAEDASTVLEAAAPESDAGPVATEPPCHGAAWCTVATSVSPLSVLGAVWGTGKNDVWAVGSGGAIAHYDGMTWSTIPSGVRNTFNAVWGSGPDDVYVVGAADAILHSTGARGGTATLAPLPIEGLGLEGTRIHTIWGTSANDVRLGSDYYFYLDSESNVQTGCQFVLSDGAPGSDGGAASPRWIATGNDEPDTVVRSIWGAASGDFWVSASQLQVPGREAIMFHGLAADGGVAFTQVDSQSSSPLEAIHGTSKSDVWAVGAGGTIRHITGADTRWQRIESPTTETLHAVWASAPDDVWAVGENATIVHYDGKTFTASRADIPDGRKPALYGIWGSAPNDVWVVGDAIVLHYTGSKGGAGEEGGAP